MMKSQLNKLWKAAVKARKSAHAPYSRYLVGSSVLVKNKIYFGCNVENASYGATICAERSAILNAVANGAKKLDAILVVTKNAATPCAMCLQVITEFADSNLDIYFATPTKIVGQTKLKKLLSSPFRKSDL